MSTAIYVVVLGSGREGEILFAFGDDVDSDVMFDEVLENLQSQGVDSIKRCMITSSDFFEEQLYGMMDAIQTELDNW